MSFGNTPGWFALTTRPNHEHAATRGLSNQGLETYLPVYRARKRWSDRVRESDAVLFPGYVFCRFGLREKLRVLQAPGVRSIVGSGQRTGSGGRRRDLRGTSGTFFGPGHRSLAVCAHRAKRDHRTRTLSPAARRHPADQRLMASGGQRRSSGLLNFSGSGRRHVVAGWKRLPAWEPSDESSPKNVKRPRCGAWRWELRPPKWPALFR